MRREEFSDFSDLIEAVHEMRQLDPPTPRALALMFKILARYPMDHVRAGVELMLTDGGETYRVPVQPAHIIAAMEKHIAEVDGRPTAAEAWGMALEAQNEALTVRLTDEVLAAASACRELMNRKDQFAARTAFCAAYERIITAARRAHQSAKWTISLGTDAAARVEAVASFQAAGLLSAPQAVALLGPPETGGDYDEEEAARNRAKLRALVATMGTGSARRRQAKQAEAAAERKRLDDLKQALPPCDVDLFGTADLSNPPGTAGDLRGGPK